MRYRLGAYTLDTKRREIVSVDGASTPPPKVFALLIHLIEHRDRVVSKDELFERLWPGIHVGDASLSSCIKAVRLAIGDDGRAQRLIRTHHGHGYRFVGVVTVEEPATRTDAVNTAEPATDASPEVPAAPGALKERKLISVLDAALDDASAMARWLDTEALDEIVERFQIAAASVVERHGGAISQRLPDGVLALFGAPRAYDDPCRRSVAAALELRAEVADLRRQVGGELAVRIGVHSGTAVVGPADPATAQIHIAVGVTTERAKALRDLAPPQTVLVSGATRDVLATEVEAEAHPVLGAGPVFRIHRFLSDRSGVLSTTRAPSPFVGRDLEIALLSDRLQRIAAHAGQVVAVSGEPGIGKSRLLDEFAGLAANRGLEPLRAHCVPRAAASPFFLLKRLLRRMAGVSDDASTDELLDELERAWPGGQREWPAKRALVTDLFEAEQDGTRAGDLDPAARRLGIFTALHELLIGSGEEARVLMVEDVHWIDPSSEDWLTALIDRVAGQRLLVVVSHRPTYQPPWLARGAVTKITLEGLAPSVSRRLVQALLPGPEIAQEVRERLIERGGGNPFFLEELARAFAEDERLVTIPLTVQAVLAARIDQLSTAEKQLLHMAAVIGPHAPVDLLAQVDGLQEAERHELLLGLQRRDLMVQSRQGGRPMLSFRHALTQEVAYAGLLKRRKLEMHRKIALVLETAHTGLAQERPELLAHHFAAAGEVERAVRYFRDAGRQALARSAAREAIVHFEQALRELEFEPDDHAERQILLDLGVALQDVHGPGAEEVAQVYARVRELTVRTPASRDHFAALFNLWRNEIGREAFGASEPLARQLLVIAEDAGDDELRLQAHHAAWMVGWLTGKPERALEHAHAGLRCAAAAPPGADVYRFGGHDPIVCGHGALVLAHALRGDPVAARRHLATGLALAESIGHPETLLVILYRALDIALLDRDPMAAAVALERLRTLCATYDSSTARLVAAFVAGWIAHRRGDADGASGMAPALESMRGRAPIGRTQFYVATFAEVLVEQGAPKCALTLLEEALQTMRDDGAGHWAESETLRVLGLALAAAPAADIRRSRGCLGAALRVARQQRADTLIARVRAAAAAVNRRGS